MQLEKMTLEELKSLRKDLDKAISSFEERRRLEVRAKLEEQAREMGFSLSELVDPPKKRKITRAPKYRHPENADLTWTGRGRRPSWIAEALERGETLEQFEI